MNKYKRARLLAELTQTEAGLVLGVTRQSIANWEHDFCEPQVEGVLEVYDILAVYKSNRKR